MEGLQQHHILHFSGWHEPVDVASPSKSPSAPCSSLA